MTRGDGSMRSKLNQLFVQTVRTRELLEARVQCNALPLTSHRTAEKVERALKCLDVAADLISEADDLTKGEC